MTAHSIKPKIALYSSQDEVHHVGRDGQCQGLETPRSVQCFIRLRLRWEPTDKQMDNRVFCQATIAGTVFEGVVTASGPSIACRAGGGVALGISGLRQFQPDTTPHHRYDAAFGWWVVKYTDEARIGLPNFTLAHVRQLSDIFGLVLLTERDPFPADRIRQDYFFTSPAWDALRQWTGKHPRIAKSLTTYDPYLPGWYARAAAETKLRQA